MSSQKSVKSSFCALLSMIFLDNLGLIIIYPIFTPLVLKPIYTLLPQDYSLSVRLILLSALIAAFPFAQFIAGPIIGHIADIKGRKPAFIFALFGEAIGFSLTGLAIVLMNYPLLFFSRLLTGFFAGNLTICLSAISDICPDVQRRSKNFGIASSIIGISFVIAIIIGGILSDRALNVLFNSSFPFWIMTLFSLVNVFIIVSCFTDSKPSNRDAIAEKKQFFNLLKGVKHLYFIFFFFMLGWAISLQFLSTFLIEYFTETKTAITSVFIAIGVSWCVGNMGINRFLLRHFHPKKILFYSLILSTVSLFVASESRDFLLFIHCIIFASLFASIAWSNCLALISIKAPSHLQGKFMGMSQSVATISVAFAPFFGGMVAGLDIRIIYLFASCSLLIAALILITHKLNSSFNS